MVKCNINYYYKFRSKQPLYYDTPYTLFWFVLFIWLGKLLGNTYSFLLFPIISPCYSKKKTQLQTKSLVVNTDGIDLPLTTALLKISYDGRHFTGWSSGDESKNVSTDTTTYINLQNLTKRQRRNRRDRIMKPKGFVRSVQNVLQSNLAKLYGNINPKRIIVEGCSRTDKGVHAIGMVAQIYCLDESTYHTIIQRQNNGTMLTYDDDNLSAFPGKRLPHPYNSTDCSSFVPLPKTIQDLAYTLNRMCNDIKIMAIAPTPNSIRDNVTLPFHPTHACKTKTYRYTISTGPIHDPTNWKNQWYIGNVLSTFESKVNEACNIFIGTHDFIAFQGTTKSSSEKRKRTQQSTICTIESFSIKFISKWYETSTYEIEIIGNRFLYKMVRFLIGAIIAVGKDEISISTLQEMLQTKNRILNSFECAPAHALVLHDVQYYIPINWTIATM